MSGAAEARYDPEHGMSAARLNNRLDRPVREAYDHVLGPADAQFTLVEYGSYACPYCRAANEQIAGTRDRFGDRLRYVFRHRPLKTAAPPPPPKTAEEDALRAVTHPTP
jgi:protein-disulfide isomerase